MLPSSAAFTPVGVSVAMPSSTKPMWPTEEYAISRFTSVCTRQHSAPTTMPATASAPSSGASVSAPSGSTGSATRTRP